MSREAELPFPLSNLRDYKGTPSGLWLRDSARPTPDNPHPAVAIIGESGAGKTATKYALLKTIDEYQEEIGEEIPIFIVTYEAAMDRAEENLGIPRADWEQPQYIRMSGGLYLDYEEADRERLSLPRSILILESISVDGYDGLDRGVSTIERIGFEQRKKSRAYDIAIAHMNADPFCQRKSSVVRFRLPDVPDEYVIRYLRDVDNIETIGVEDSPDAGRLVKSMIGRQAIPRRMYGITHQLVRKASSWRLQPGNERLVQAMWRPDEPQDFEDPYHGMSPMITDPTPILLAEIQPKAAIVHHNFIKGTLKLGHSKVRLIHNAYIPGRVTYLSAKPQQSVQNAA